MKTKQLYLVAGVFLGLILSTISAVGAVALGAGIAWLYIFGDNPWPAASHQILVLMALIVGLSVACAVVWIGYRLGHRRGGSLESPGLMDTIRLMRGECHHAENEESLPT